jgi:hypothetical protein
LRGRDPECALLDDLIAAVRGGESRTLVVRGEAGIGKSALLSYAVVSAVEGGIGHNLPQEAPAAFVDAVLEVGGVRK